MVLEGDLIPAPTETLSLAGESRRNRSESLSIKSVDEWRAYTVDCVKFPALVFKDRRDLRFAESIRFAESRETAPGNLYGAD